MGRIASIDFGRKRIGIALSDERKKIAFPLKTVAGGAKAVGEIRAALGEKLKEVEEIIVGWPLLLSGQEGEMALAARQFASALEAAFQLPVKLVDERFSSRLADRQMAALAKNRKERTEQLDTASAALLLQTYLDSRT